MVHGYGPRGCGPHGCGPGYFHGGGHIAYVPRRRYWRDAMDDGLLDNLYFGPPRVVVSPPPPSPQPHTVVLHGKHFLMVTLFLIFIVLLVASLRR